jgi:pimeloyl-ACP methyl ester carboxylesterase
MRDMVVLVPGIAGSVLRKDGRDLWSMTRGATYALLTLERCMTDVRLDSDVDDDGVTPSRVIPDLHLIPGLWKINGYAKVIATLLANFDMIPGRNFHEFPYDWRRDNRVAARQLEEQTSRWLQEWRQMSPDAKLILIGHSMGGLVSRYFLECLDGWRNTRMLITLGTPYGGSVNALRFLLNEMKGRLGPIAWIDLVSLVRSFTSVYQLLPTFPCFDSGDGRMVRVSEAGGIAFLDPQRIVAAGAFHQEIREAVTRHLDDEEYLRSRYTVRPIVGTFQPTLQSARRLSNNVEFSYYQKLFTQRDGDGIVPRLSATPSELLNEEGAVLTADRHGSLQNNDSVLDRAGGILSGEDPSLARAPAGSSVALGIDDAFPSGEPIAFQVRSEDPGAKLIASITELNTGRQVLKDSVGRGEDWHVAEVPPLPPGSYRIKVTGQSLVEPVTDTFIVLETENQAEITASGGRSIRVVRTYPSIDDAEPDKEVDLVEVGGNHTGIRIGNIGTEAQIRVGAPSEPTLEQRYLQGRFPERVRLGEAVSLLVRIGLQDTEPYSTPLKPWAIPKEGVEVLLNLHSPGFISRSGQRMPLRVLAGRDSDWVLFDLEAAEEGVHTIEVMAFLGGTYLGVLSIQATVDADVITGPSVDRAAVVRDRQRDPGEISLLIYYDSEHSVYRYQLIDWSGAVPEEGRSERLLQTPYQAVEALVGQLNSLARGHTPWDARATQEWLKGQGITLWNSFIPTALQNEFWARRDRITRMTIVSKGDPVPWELLYPFTTDGNDAGFLVDQFPVARWLFGGAPPSRLRLDTANLVLAGSDTLTSAPTEVQAIADLLAAKSVTTQAIGELDNLLQLFTSGSFSLLHFTCHNAFVAGAPNASQVMMGNQPFQPVFLAQHAGRFRDTSPIVFMNACRTDGQAPLYTRLDGWAPSFLTAGAGAFVGSLWEVVDSSAAVYAQEFYQAALGGDTLGDAARKARDAIREEPGDPTWLAYTLYGDPAATLVLPP